MFNPQHKKFRKFSLVRIHLKYFVFHLEVDDGWPKCTKPSVWMIKICAPGLDQCIGQLGSSYCCCTDILTRSTGSILDHCFQTLDSFSTVGTSDESLAKQRRDRTQTWVWLDINVLTELTLISGRWFIAPGWKQQSAEAYMDLNIQPRLQRFKGESSKSDRAAANTSRSLVVGSQWGIITFLLKGGVH